MGVGRRDLREATLGRRARVLGALAPAAAGERTYRTANERLARPIQ